MMRTGPASDWVVAVVDVVGMAIADVDVVAAVAILAGAGVSALAVQRRLA